MFTSLFSYYGSKSKLSSLYPKPIYDDIIEPFGGSAAYSLKYFHKNIWINELNSRVFKIWEYLLSKDSLSFVPLIPEYMEKGTDLKTLDSISCLPVGLQYLLIAEGNRGTFGGNGESSIVSPFGEKTWHNIKPKLNKFIPIISHWKITNLDYRNLPNFKGTWFIDPPYSNKAGSRYRNKIIDYDELGKWIKDRQGQVIACGNIGETYLPFEPLTSKRLGIIKNNGKRVGEAIFILENR